MTTFALLAAIAAVGTGQRATLPPVSAQMADLMPPDPETPAHALLDRAAAVTLLRRGNPGIDVGRRDEHPEQMRGSEATRAGSRRPTRASTAEVHGVADAPVAPTETQFEAPERVVAAVRLLLGEGGPLRTQADRNTVLVEVFRLMAERGLRLPYRLLVPALSVTQSEVFAAVLEVVGERGRWLARLPGAPWGRPPSSIIDERAWEFGTTDQRVSYLAALRSRDPDEARETVELVWRDTSVEARAAFAHVIASTATSSDEPFLENCLRDRASSVHTAAQAGLVRLPASAYVDRMRDRARTCLRIASGPEGGPLLRVEVPDSDPRDGLLSTTSTDERVGTVVAAIPPGDWPSLLGRSAAQLLDLPQQVPIPSLTSAMVVSAVRWSDRDLAAALVARGVLDAGLIPLVDPELVASLVAHVGIGAFASDQLAVLGRGGPWSEPLTRSVGGLLLHHPSPTPAEAAFLARGWAMLSRYSALTTARGWAQRARSYADAGGRHAGIRAASEASSVLYLRAALWDYLRAIPPVTGAS